MAAFRAFVPLPRHFLTVPCRRYIPLLEQLEDRLPPGTMLDLLFFPAFAGSEWAEVDARDICPENGETSVSRPRCSEQGSVGETRLSRPPWNTVGETLLSRPVDEQHTVPRAQTDLVNSFTLDLDQLAPLMALANSQPAVSPRTEHQEHAAHDHAHAEPLTGGTPPVIEAVSSRGSQHTLLPLAQVGGAGLAEAVARLQLGQPPAGGILSGPDDVLLLSPGYYWRYLDNGTDQGTAWRSPAFNDSGWADGLAQLGYGDGDEATVVGYGPDANNKYITTYFRTWFYVDDTTPYQTLQTWLLRDDGAIVYLNGAEIYRDNLPAGTVNYRTLASTAIGGDDENAWYHSALPATGLQTGWNSIAIEIHQSAANSSDISLDFALVGSTVVRFAVVGDYGVDTAAERAVADLIKAWYPDFVVTTGDNNYPTGSASTIVPNIGQYYCPFIRNPDAPTNQRCTSGHAANRFYPTAGNHDWDSTPGLQPYLNYFTLPTSSGNERYYEASWGPVQLFAVDSDSREPNGITSASTQGNWLRTRLAAATAPWKVITLHHPPYSSGTSHGSTPNLQWPYQQWGASAVLAGHEHNYERIIRSGFPYLVNGLGGQSRNNFGTPVQGSQARYNGNWGAMYVQAAPNYLYFAFVSIDDTYFDDYLLY